MPDREITEEQLRSVKDWIYEVKGGELVRNLLPGMDNGVWAVEGEPVVIYTRDKITGERPFQQYTSTRLLVSDKHAKELTDEGTVPFEGF